MSQRRCDIREYFKNQTELVSTEEALVCLKDDRKNFLDMNSSWGIYQCKKMELEICLFELKIQFLQSEIRRLEAKLGSL